jgi:hypothetical protein
VATLPYFNIFTLPTAGGRQMASGTEKYYSLISATFTSSASIR